MSPLEQHMETVAGLVAGTLEGRALARFMADGADPGAAARVYRNSSLLAACEALKSNYMATALIMGDEFFACMARSYVDANRPRVRSLVGYGESLPAFITGGEADHGFRWLSSIARLDRAWLAAHLAADAALLEPARLAELAEDEAALLAARFDLHPSMQLVESQWRVFDLWAGLRGGEVPETKQALEEGACHVLVWRSGDEVTYRRLSQSEFAFLSALRGGHALGSASEAELAVADAFDSGAALAACLMDGLFSAIHINREDNS